MRARAPRRTVFGHSGRRFTICGGRRPRYAPVRDAARLTWITGATLVLVLLFSVYAAERPPAFPNDPSRTTPNPMARYTFADVLSAAAR